MHIVTAHLLKTPLVRIRILPGGLRAELKERDRSYRKLVLIYLSGPVGNLLAAAAFYGSQGFGQNLFEGNLAIGLFNLIPAHPLDGGQILLIILYNRMGGSRAVSVLKRLSVVLRIVFCLSGILQIVLYKNPSLLIAVLILPGHKLLEESMGVMRFENLFTRRQRIMKKKVYHVRHIAAMEDCSLGEVLKKLDYDSFHIIYLLNSSMEITGSITEQQILKALESCSSQEPIKTIIH